MCVDCVLSAVQYTETKINDCVQAVYSFFCFWYKSCTQAIHNGKFTPGWKKDQYTGVYTSSILLYTSNQKKRVHNLPLHRLLLLLVEVGKPYFYGVLPFFYCLPCTRPKSTDWNKTDETHRIGTYGTCTKFCTVINLIPY